MYQSLKVLKDKATQQQFSIVIHFWSAESIQTPKLLYVSEINHSKNAIFVFLKNGYLLSYLISFFYLFEY